MYYHAQQAMRTGISSKATLPSAWRYRCTTMHSRLRAPVYLQKQPCHLPEDTDVLPCTAGYAHRYISKSNLAICLKIQMYYHAQQATRTGISPKTTLPSAWRYRCTTMHSRLRAPVYLQKQPCHLPEDTDVLPCTAGYAHRYISKSNLAICLKIQMYYHAQQATRTGISPKATLPSAWRYRCTTMHSRLRAPVYLQKQPCHLPEDTDVLPCTAGYAHRYIS